jgi:hypothetical protein
MTCMSHVPESAARHEAAANDDSSTEPALPQQGGARTDGSVDPDGAADRSRHSHDPYQPL